MKRYLKENKKAFIFLVVGLLLGILMTLLFYTGVVLKDGYEEPVNKIPGSIVH